MRRLRDICFANRTLEGVDIKCASIPNKTIKLTSFFRCINHSSTSSRWNMWQHGSTRTLSPLTKSDKQMAHSSWASNQGRRVGSGPGWEVEGLWPVPSESPPSWAAGDPRHVLPSSRSAFEDSRASSVIGSPPSCFSQPDPVQTSHGRFRTISSGARSRCAARAARIRCIKRVMKVKAEGRRRIMMNVMIGLYLG